jgi:hypothetical protein
MSDAWGRVSNLVSDGIPSFICVRYGLLLGHRNERRRFCNFMFIGIPRLTYTKYGVFWRRRDTWWRDAWRRFFNVVYDGIPRFICAKCVTSCCGVGFPVLFSMSSGGPPSGNVASYAGVAMVGVVTNCIPWFICPKYNVLLRRRAEWHLDAWRGFSSVVSSVVPRLTCAKYGVFWRRRDDSDATLSVGFPYRVRWHPDVHLYQICCRVCVATLGFGSPTSFPMASQGSSPINMASLRDVATIGVPTLGVGLWQSLHMASRGFCCFYLLFGVGVCFPTSSQM